MLAPSSALLAIWCLAVTLAATPPAIATQLAAAPQPSTPPPASGQSPEASPPTELGSSESLLAKAMAELEQHNISGAVTLLEQAESATSPDPRLPALLGALYVEAGRHAEALEVLVPLAESDNADVAVLYNAGRAAAAVEQYEQAQRYLEASAAAFPASPAARELGLLHLRQGRWMAAYLSLKPWSIGHPNDTEVGIAAARCALQLGRPAEAELLLQTLPNDQPSIKLLWANTLLLKGDAWSALAIAKELAQEVPEGLEPQALMLLADIYLELEQPDLVVEELAGKTDKRPLVAVRVATALRQLGQITQALELLAPFSRGLIEEDSEVGSWVPGRGSKIALEYGRLLAAAGRHSEAVPYLRASTEMTPYEADAWKTLAAELDEVQDEAGAREARTQLARIEALAGAEVAGESEAGNLGSDPTARQLRRALALLELGAEQEALRVARQEKALVPQDPRPTLVEAQLLMRLGRGDEALTVMDAGSRWFPANADVQYYRGVVEATLNRLENAELSFRRALELVPQHTPAMTDLAALLIRLNRLPEARTMVERVLVISPGDETATRLLEQIESS